MSPRSIALRSGRIAWSIAIGLALLFWFGLIGADEPVRVRCHEGKCLVPQAFLVELLQKADAGEQFSLLCGWPR